MHSENLFTNYSQIENNAPLADKLRPVSYTHLRAHETSQDLVSRMPSSA